MNRGLLALLLLPLSSTCAWKASPEDPIKRPFPLSEVQEVPRLLSCARYRRPVQNDAPVHAMKVRFTVTQYGSVIDAEPDDEGPLLASRPLLGQALSMATSCRFRPGRRFGRPVSVRRSMWFFW
ncbi:hypothetical protein ACFL0I_03035 [Gemmatimonadota bacterium]